MTPAQCRMALAALDWSLEDLAEAAGVRLPALAHFLGGGYVAPELTEKLRTALESGDERGRCRFIMSGDFTGGIAFDPARLESASRNPMTARMLKRQD